MQYYLFPFPCMAYIGIHFRVLFNLIKELCVVWSVLWVALACWNRCISFFLFQGVLHTVGGYLLYTAATFKYVFDYQPDDVYWCTADIGWITGHSYITYGPLANGATSVLVSALWECSAPPRSSSIPHWIRNLSWPPGSCSPGHCHKVNDCRILSMFRLKKRERR